ncbi:MAG: hypothetical protein OEY28_12070, partial [Nitrospira sp.]|nr:hypothetical protein [Nitrospira sp.]
TQTVADSDGTILGTWVIGAEYDATGFNRATVYSDGRTVRHTPDALNRLLESFDETNSVSIATYIYGGPSRLIERSYGNGTRTEITYESSGCGCGGFSGFVERIEHRLAGTTEVLAATNRRYDRVGNVMAEQRDHDGGLGVVYRYDKTYRLEDTYYGVDLSPDYGDLGASGGDGMGTRGIELLDDPQYTPLNFGLKRAYNLDERGNRTGSTGIRDSDDTSNTIYDTNYTVSTDDMNLYTSVDGDSYTYDDIEQRTYDAATGLYYAYDYKGALMAADKDSSLTSPEQVYRHDVGGNRVLEEGWYNTTYYNVHKTALLTGKKPGGGCGGGGSACIEEIRDEGGSETGSIQYVYGKGQMGIVHELAEYDNGAGGFDTIHRYRHEDQSGSLIGVTDEDGYRTHEYWYEDFGAPISKPIIFDGQMARISGVTHDSPNPDETTITITGTTLSTDQFNGAELAVSDPDDGSDRLRIGTVLDTTSTTIVVSDAGTYDIAAGLYEGAGDGGTVLNNFVIYEFNDSSEFDAPSYHSGGEWTSAPNLDDNGTPSIPGDDTTDFEDTNGNFAAYQVGWKLIADVELFAPLTIVDIPDTITLTVAGDASTLAASGSRYRVVAPPGVDVSTGALETNTNDAGSRYLYVEMRYNPPQVGYYVDPPGAPLLGTYGAQTGDSLVGTYVIAKDVYKPETGTLLSMPSDIPRDPWGPPEPDPRFDEERAQKQYGERKGAPPGDPSDTEMRSCWDSWTRSGNFEEFRYWEFHVDWFDGWYSSAEENEANNPNAPVNRN